MLIVPLKKAKLYFTTQPNLGASTKYDFFNGSCAPFGVLNFYQVGRCNIDVYQYYDKLKSWVKEFTENRHIDYTQLCFYHNVYIIHKHCIF